MFCWHEENPSLTLPFLDHNWSLKSAFHLLEEKNIFNDFGTGEVVHLWNIPYSLEYTIWF